MKIKFSLLNYEDYLEKLKKLYGSKDLVWTKNPKKLEIYKIYKFIKMLNSTNDWSFKWVEKLNHLESILNIKPIIKKETIEINHKNLPGFLTFIEPKLRILRKVLNMNSFNTHIHLMTEKECFYDLNFVTGNAPINLKETFYTKDQKVLTSHTTPLILLNKQTNVLDYSKVFRRENVDKTHLCQFYQLEYSKISVSNNPVKELKQDLCTIFSTFGIDPKKIEFRPTRYPYVLPGMEIFYIREDNSSFELGGCGILDRNIRSETTLAAGIGLERIYSLVHNLQSISEIYFCY